VPRGAAVLNLVKAWAFVGAIAGAFAALGWVIGGTTTAALFALCTLLAATGVYRYGDRALLGMLGARPFALAEDPLLRSSVDKVAAKLEVRPPQLYLIDDGFPRIFAVGRGPASSTLAVSTGTLRTLRPDELEAVVAHDLADALLRLDRASELIEFAASPTTEPLYPIDPFVDEGIARMFKTHPPLDARLLKLRELGATASRNGREALSAEVRTNGGSEGQFD
jgi:Zn-dependent protease with chaperone function